MRTVAVLVPRAVVGFDVSAACQAFAMARRADGAPLYEVMVCGDAPVVATAAGTLCFVLTPTRPLAAARAADTVIVPGVDREAAAGQDDVLDVLRAAHAEGRRVAAICTGAFLLAEAGLLDGRTATTHWLAAGGLAARHPAVTVDPDLLFTDEDEVLTSAGVAAGLDLCLHLIGRDFGADVAARAAAALVVPYRREGTAVQYVRQPNGGGDGGRGSLAATLDWLQHNLHRPLRLADIARAASLSERQLHRRFRAGTGTTPLRWLLRLRVERARALLETTELPVEQIAGLCGFGSAVSLRAHFRERQGCGPAAYRKRFRAAGGSATGGSGAPS
ncbi:GlxA family transcriptional regulator [Streptomyces marincola]|uniref:GlxA family transcriptional regulator n=1 Tax=Streptomyces marincola TaxID=2878388 RepID=UPI001CF3B64C|nr:helix-turn-helix domain-containing protein [Streptomyces marincola]UCM86737.1 helix-turn-helix domain-containing protein [Streptomyces marincola]